MRSGERLSLCKHNIEYSSRRLLRAQYHPIAFSSPNLQIIFEEILTERRFLGMKLTRMMHIVAAIQEIGSACRITAAARTDYGVATFYELTDARHGPNELRSCPFPPCPLPSFVPLGLGQVIFTPTPRNLPFRPLPYGL